LEPSQGSSVQRRNLKRRLILPVLAALIALLPGCKPGIEGRTEVVFWAMGAEGEHVAKLMPEFERRNPGINIRVQMIPWNAAHEKLLTAYASNSLPDMCQLGNTWIPEFYMLKAIDSLTSWIARSHTISEEGYFPGIWDTNVMDSVLYGVPWYVDTRVMFYRSDLLSKAGYSRAPRTWDEWFDVSQALVKRKLSEYAILLPINNEWAPQVIMGLQNGSPLLKDRGTYADFSGPEFTGAITSFHKFFTEGLAPVQTTQIVNVYQGMADGIFAMYITGPWNIGEFQRRMPPGLQDAWMTAPLPGPDSAIGTSLAGGSSLVMFSSSGKKAAVWKLIEYLSEPDVQMEFYRLTGDLPARIESWRRPPLEGNKYAAAFFGQLNHVVATPKVPEWEQIAQMVRQVTELVSMDRMGVDDAMHELDRSVNLMLEKRRWMLAHAK
jgi:multiple sugar transport system substrate-binding protein